MESIDGMTYELFVRRCFRCDRYDKPFADADVWGALIIKYHWNQENNGGKKIPKHMDYFRAFAEVKEALLKSINHVVKNNPQKIEFCNSISLLGKKVTDATTIKDLEVIILEGAELLHIHKLPLVGE